MDRAMSKKRDANDVIRSGKALDPAEATPTLHIDSHTRCGALDLERTENGSVRPTLRNAVTLLSEHPRWRETLGLDVRAETQFFLCEPPGITWPGATYPRQVTDTDITAIIRWMSFETGADLSPDKVHRAVNLVARQSAFDPVLSYLDKLRWDGKSRLDEWLPVYLGAESTEYARLVGSKFLISAVARTYAPGCQVDHVLVLEGKQGIGKTSALRVLGGEYHRADPPALGTRDSKEWLRGAMIAEIGELDSINKSEVSAVKNFLSEAKDHYRTPYARRSETRPRRAVFVATTNETEYLRDHTGNRRFWPVECTRANLEALRRDRDQIWAEAVVRYRRGEPWHLQGGCETQLATAEQQKRTETDPWEERIAELAARQSELRLAEVFRELQLSADRQSQREKIRVSRILQRLGFWRCQVREKGAQVWVYRRAPTRYDVSPVSPVSPPDSRLTAGPSMSDQAHGDTGDSEISPEGAK